MTTKYAILNPMTGTYSYADDERAALSEMKKIATEFYLIHTHGSPISKIKVNDDNSETWESYQYTDSGI